MPISRAPARLRHQLFTSNGTFIVPAGVNVIWIDGCGGGAGGGGGDPTPGGGGSGGGAAVGVVMARFPVTPGETITVTVGAFGAGGNAGANGGWGGLTTITGSLQVIYLPGGGQGHKGTPSAGGPATTAPFAAGGPGQYGPNGTMTGNASTALGFTYHLTNGEVGGALSMSGGLSRNLPMLNEYAPGGTGGSSGGGGGAGASCTFGRGGGGGSNGAAGQAPTAVSALYYGSGGGGGSGNAAGGNGAPGFVRIYWEQ